MKISAYLVAAALAAFSAIPAVAQTYSCELDDTDDQDDDWIKDVDQVIVDVPGQSIDIRVARTMGTANPQNIVFGNKDWGSMGQDTMTVRDTGYFVTGAAMLYSGTPYIFKMWFTGAFNMTYYDSAVPTNYKWTCTK